MSLPAVLLVLAAAVVHALWNRSVHAGEDRLAVMAVSSLGAGVLLSPAVALAPPTTVWPFVLASGVVEAVYGVLLAGAYARGSIAVAYPVGRGTAPLLVTLGGWVALQQRPSTGAVLGAVAVGGGLVVVATAARRWQQLPAVGWAVATGVAIATYSVIDAGAVTRLSGPLAAAGYIGVGMGVQGLLLTALVVRSGRTGADRLTAVGLSGLGVALGVVTAYLAVVVAFQLAPAGRVSTLRESSVLVAVALSAQRRQPVVWFGAALVVAGALLSAFG